ncbi:MAG: hypothetical protein A2Z21_05330 [Candidatus Fraserbacteria bacterium RBG_16_55_9]|uniref:DUF5678 domain-containing protein n=1 Tax=Fraserbacteria sp. (strain RBG_16_55_9) TaxID=1817864 RepID=A0A1F5UV15_FRAXR|nr:MAG: hypothetical protein A2Z21_05330 [Candidatus Fraserbacteria bacterium RBG_16_55_9]
MKACEALSLQEIHRRFKDEWVLIRVLEEDELGQPLTGTIIAHSRDREEIYAAQASLRGDLALFYTGEIPKKGYAVAF